MLRNYYSEINLHFTWHYKLPVLKHGPKTGCAGNGHEWPCRARRVATGMPIPCDGSRALNPWAFRPISGAASLRPGIHAGSGISPHPSGYCRQYSYKAMAVAVAALWA